MKKTCVGETESPEGVRTLMDAMIAEGIQVISVANCPGVLSLCVFGIADDDLQIEHVIDRLKNENHAMWLTFENSELIGH